MDSGHQLGRQDSHVGRTLQGLHFSPWAEDQRPDPDLLGVIRVEGDVKSTAVSYQRTVGHISHLTEWRYKAFTVFDNSHISASPLGTELGQGSQPTGECISLTMPDAWGGKIPCESPLVHVLDDLIAITETW